MTTLLDLYHLSLPELETKMQALWDEHDALEEEAVVLRNKIEEIERQMWRLHLEADKIREHMKKVAPINVKDISIKLQLLKEDINSISPSEKEDKETVASILRMIEGMQLTYHSLQT